MILRRLKLEIKIKKEIKLSGVIILVLISGFFIFGEIKAKDDEEKKIVINEVMYNSINNVDWFEIFIKEDLIIDNKWGLMDEVEIEKEDGKRNICHKLLNKGEKEFKKGEYIVFTDNENDFKKEYPDFKGKLFDTTLDLKSSDEDAARISDDKCGNFTDEVKYNPKKDEKVEKGYSLELEDGKWRQSYVIGGTPGEENSQKPEPIEYEKTIRINEIFPDPKEKPEGKYEFIEIYNYGDEKIDLKGWEILDKSNKKISPKEVLEAGDYLVFYNKISLNNDGDKIILRNPDGDIDKVKYEETIEGFSYSFNSEKNGWEWSSIITPGKKNEFDKKKKYSNKIRINEVLPNPSGEEGKDEFIELYNFGKEKIDLKNWTLKDSSKSGKYVFSESFSIKPGEFLTVKRKEFKFALNNSGGESVYLLDPNGKTVFKIDYEKAKESVSFGFDEESKRWRWSRFLTPGKVNNFDKIPEIKIKIDEDVYKNIYADFKAYVKDVDKKELKIRWDFGDGKRSYKQETRHKYEKEGKYDVFVRVFNGSEDFEIKRIIEVEKYPRRDVEIVSFMPNPEGKDNEAEWVEVMNNSKKKVNMLKWSLATGKDKRSLINHPINDEIYLNSGKKKKITREYSYFSLNNKEGCIELRYPDGKTADRVCYKDKKGIKDNDIYQKNELGEWIRIIFGATENEASEKEKIIEDNLFLSEYALNIGKKSQKEMDRNSIFFSGYHLKKEILSLFWQNGKKARIENNSYFFNPKAKVEKHYLVKFFEQYV
ncbi:MAG: lamin tail domain-containing protein [Candidatus Moranbacteria bacterium]|jgi:hypothetical protein|nr:lamin tail domain-containing protein [Candidatus Moranbacteria bacterium]MDX9855582.1 lamin tail domain-containing protein [Candidatus Moranbacteria bacterium]